MYQFPRPRDTQVQVKKARKEEGKTTEKSVGKNNRYKKMKIQISLLLCFYVAHYLSSFSEGK